MQSPAAAPPMALARVALVATFTVRLQAGKVSPGGEPHTLGVPPPPQVCGDVHMPQPTVRDRPQLSAPVTVPQFFPSCRQKAASVSGVQGSGASVVPSDGPPQISTSV